MNLVDKATIREHFEPLIITSQTKKILAKPRKLLTCVTFSGYSQSSIVFTLYGSTIIPSLLLT